MLIRRNSREFIGIQNLLEKYAGQSSRKKLIRLFVVKAGETIKNKIPVDTLGNEADFYYDLNYSSILSHLNDPDYRLHRSSSPGLYFFKSIHFPKWEQTPFLVPKKLIDRIEEFAEIPSPKRARRRTGRAVEELPEDVPVYEGSAPSPVKRKEQKEKRVRKGSQPKIAQRKAPNEAIYGSKHRIVFSDTDEVIFEKANITLAEVLHYYDSIADHLLPYIKDRAQSFYLDGKKEIFERNIEGLYQHINLKLPAWIKQVKKYSSKNKEDRHYFVCRDKDHLFFLLKMGVYELHPWLSRISSPRHPDHLVINLKPVGVSFNEVIAVAQAAHDVLRDSFKSHIKLSEHEGFHIYVPWEERVSIEMSRRIAIFIARQIHARMEKVTTLDPNDKAKKGKVLIDVSENAEPPRTLIAPYSVIMRSDNAQVAAPLKWNEVKKGLDPSGFTIHTMLERVAKLGDVWKE